MCQDSLFYRWEGIKKSAQITAETQEMEKATSTCFCTIVIANGASISLLLLCEFVCLRVCWGGGGDEMVPQ